MNRDVLEYVSIVRRRAAWASAVRLSASSRKMILKLGAPKLLDDEAQGLRDGRDRIDQGRRRPAGEEEAHRVSALIDHEGAAVATLREQVAHDLLPEDRRRTVVVDFDDRIDGRDASGRDAGRPTAFPDPQADVRFLRSADATDAQDLRSDESRLDRLGDRGVDEVRPAAREAFEAPAGGTEERPEQPRKEARDRPGVRLPELDRPEVDEAGDRVLQSRAIGGPGLQDRIADVARVLVREDVVVR